MNSRNQIEDRRASARRIREVQFLGNKREIQLCPSIERRSVTSRYHGSTISLRVRHAICTLLCRRCTTTTAVVATSYFEEPALWSRLTHTKIVTFFFLT